MSGGVRVAGLTVERCLFDFVSRELLPGVGLEEAEFWRGLAGLVADLAPRNLELLAERERLQGLIDRWHRSRAGRSHDPQVYQDFLAEIGYLRPEPEGAEVATTGVDVELAEVAGPQLVVPASNARFAINAVNARWGSLYDAVYGSDVIAQPVGGAVAGGYDPGRGAEVVAWVGQFLDRSLPLAQGSHARASCYRVVGGALGVELDGGEVTGLSAPAQLVGYRGRPEAPSHVLLTHHGLGVELRLDRQHPVGALHPAGLCDVQVEAAVTTIVDLEDSVAAVDAEDKVLGYRNWLGLNRGTLAEQVTKDGVTFTRTLNQDRRYTTPGGSEVVVPGRSLMLVRNVGLLMRTDAVLDAAGDPVPEGILDAVITTLAAIPVASSPSARPNSRTGSVYVVKPKLHGPEEVAFTVRLLAATEVLLGLPPATVKIGIMDEERRTSVNLRAAIEAAADRVVFINTGFLDRTGDEIHTSMEAGVMVRKAEMRSQPWIAAYEEANVDTGLALGMGGRAQIGKGMWAMPDLMADMVEQKVQHPRSGASTAWVPSPTAAVLHALHYHDVDVAARQQELLARGRRDRLADLLTIPLAAPPDWTAAERRRELENNAQSILGYVVRWIDQGIGCSKVPDTDDVALMEDRATLRISSQLLANWLRHGVLSRKEVLAGFTRMAEVVDRQNAADPGYRPMTADLGGSAAFGAALELVLEGAAQPSGYTEPILHRYRRRYKASLLEPEAETRRRDGPKGP